jgi:MFS family permease
MNSSPQTAPETPSTAGAKVMLIGVSIVGFCLIMAAVGRGMGETYAVFLLPITAEMGWDRAGVASVFAAFIAAMGLFSPLSGHLFDRFGARFVYVLGVACLGLGYYLAGEITTLWQFYLCMGLLNGFGGALIWQVPAQSLISRWFDKHLATAISFAYAGYGFGLLTLAPLSQVLIEARGWRVTYQDFGIAFLILIPIIVLLPWKRIEQGAPGNPRRTRAGRAEGGYSLGEALKTRVFWAMWFIYFMTALAIFGVSVQSVAYLVERGFSELEAAGSFGIAGMLSFAGMFLTGAAADRYGRSLVATVSYVLTIVGVCGLALLQLFDAKYLVFAWIIPYGLSMGARGPIITTLQATLFHGRGLGAIYGMTILGQGLGAGLSAWGGGLIFDLTGGYNLTFAISIASALICIALFWLVPEVRHGRMDARK